jgi:16S rRNA (uracil1498-N3)-methyltransferase
MSRESPAIPRPGPPRFAGHPPRGRGPPRPPIPKIIGRRSGHPLRRARTSGHRQITVAVDNTTQIPPPRPALTLAFAIPKGPRQDLLIEKCTELGVSVLQPIHTTRSVAGATAHRLDKWQRTAVEAAKQAGLAWLPDIRSPLNLEQLLGETPRYDLTLIALNSAVHPIHDLFPTLRAANTVLTLVGPEGGWTDEEVTSARTAGATPVSLGPNTLRIETAAIALAAALHAILNHQSPDRSSPSA